MITLADFLADRQGKGFSDVVEDSRYSFIEIIDFFNDVERKQRLCAAEKDHDQPALAGVIKEFESLPTVAEFFNNTDGHETQRFRQSIGVLVRMHMEEMGWRTTGQKDPLGTRVKVAPGTTSPGAYHNDEEDLSYWFTQSERYTF